MKDSFKFLQNELNNNDLLYNSSIKLDFGNSFSRKVESPVRIFRQFQRIQHQSELNQIISNLEDQLQQYYHQLQKNSISCSTIVPSCSSIFDFWGFLSAEPAKKRKSENSMMNNQLLEEICKLEEWFENDRKRSCLNDQKKCFQAFVNTFKREGSISIPSLKKWHKFSQLVLMDLITKIESDREKVSCL
jgi:hypothetical protein